MPNPFLGAINMSTPSHISDVHGDDTWYDSSPYHVAAFLVLALVILTVMRVSGFRAIVGIGRG